MKLHLRDICFRALLFFLYERVLLIIKQIDIPLSIFDAEFPVSIFYDPMPLRSAVLKTRFGNRNVRLQMTNGSSHGGFAGLLLLGTPFFMRKMHVREDDLNGRIPGSAVEVDAFRTAMELKGL